MSASPRPPLKVAKDLIKRFSRSMLPWSYAQAVQVLLSPCCIGSATVVATCIPGSPNLWTLTITLNQPISTGDHNTITNISIVNFVSGQKIAVTQNGDVPFLGPGEVVSWTTDPFDLTAIGGSGTYEVQVSTAFIPNLILDLQLNGTINHGVLTSYRVDGPVTFSPC